MKPIRDLIRELHRRSLWQVLGIYLLASWAIIGGVGTLGDALGLPDWFPRLALGLLIVGLPIVLATAFVQEGAPGREAHRSDTPAAEASRASGLFTWRRSFTGGVLGFALWGVVAAGWILLGAGVRGTEPIVASGAELRLVVLPLENLTDDPELDVLGHLAADEVVAEAVRAPHVFAGTVSRIGGQVRLELELIDPSTSERVGSVEPVAGPAERMDSLVAELASRAAAEAVVVFNPFAAPWVGDISTPTTAASAVNDRITLTESGTAAQRDLAQAEIAAALGDGDEAVRLLGQSALKLASIHVDPAFDEIRSYPPFVALMTPRSVCCTNGRA